MNVSLLIFVLLSIFLIVSEAYKVPTDVQTQLKLKKRGQGCLARLLPRNPQSKAFQNELATCFKVDCALALIPKIERIYPKEFPVLKKCMGY